MVIGDEDPERIDTKSAGNFVRAGFDQCNSGLSLLDHRKVLSPTPG